MLMPTYSAPPMPLLYGVADTRRVSGMGDPWGITDLATGIFGMINAGKQRDIQRKQIAAELAKARMEQSEAAHSFALDQAKAQVAAAQNQRNTTTYALFAIGGVAAIVSVAFLLSGMKGRS